MKADSILFGALLLVIVWAPIPGGSNRAWAWSLLQAAIFVLTAVWVALWAAGRLRAPRPVAKAWPAFLVLALWLGEQALHVVPMPASWVAVLSPEAARMHHLTDILGIAREHMTLSVDPQASRTSLLKGLSYAFVFFLVLALVDTTRRAQLLLRVLVLSAVVLAIYGITLHLAGVRQLMFGLVVDHGAQASGPYVNRNHFAGYLEMNLALGIGLLIAGVSERRAGSWKRFAVDAIEWILSPKMLLRLSLCVLVIALTTTHSRMGNSAFFASLLVAGVVGIVLSRRASRNTVVLLASLVVIDLFIVGSWFGVERLAQRMEATTVGEVEAREQPAAYTLPLIRDYPLWGAGPGTFYVAFSRYRPASVTSYFDFAHNDYAQFAAESGIVGLSLLGIFVGLCLAAALRAQWSRRDPVMRGLAFAAIMGVTSILMHSWVDFNLQIPANAMLFVTLLALAWTSAHAGRRDDAQSSSGSGPSQRM